MGNREGHAAIESVRQLMTDIPSTSPQPEFRRDLAGLHATVAIAEFVSEIESLLDHIDSQQGEIIMRLRVIEGKIGYIGM